MDLTTRAVIRPPTARHPRACAPGCVWTRDDAALIYAKDKDGDEQNNLFLLDRESGQVRQLNDDPRTQEYPGAVHPTMAAWPSCPTAPGR